MARKDDSEGAGFAVDCISDVGGCCAGSETLEGRLNGDKVVEGVEAVGAAAKFAGGLRATEDQEAKERSFVAPQVKDGANAVLVLGDAGITDDGDECKIFERVKSLANFFFGEIEYRIAAGALIARVDQSVKRERIVFRRGDLFFDEGAENAELDRVQVHIYRVPQVERAACREIIGNTYVE